jgi:hypothetical protein
LDGKPDNGLTLRTKPKEGNMKRKVSETQRNWVLDRLLAGSSITPQDAMDEARIFRLASIICWLKKQSGGELVIHATREPSPGGGRYARYRIPHDALPVMRERFGTP